MSNYVRVIPLNPRCRLGIQPLFEDGPTLSPRESFGGEHELIPEQRLDTEPTPDVDQCMEDRKECLNACLQVRLFQHLFFLRPWSPEATVATIIAQIRITYH